MKPASSPMFHRMVPIFRNVAQDFPEILSESVHTARNEGPLEVLGSVVLPTMAILALSSCRFSIVALPRD
jgi:hypothetical protein